ncbi:Sulfite exporter TauE/SafE [compost metagenome]
MEKAVGTSLAIIAANSLFGFAISAQNQVPEWSLLIKISLIGVIGLTIGHQIAGKFPEARLKKGFGYFVLIVGTLIVVDQLYRI